MQQVLASCIGRNIFWRSTQQKNKKIKRVVGRYLCWRPMLDAMTDASNVFQQLKLLNFAHGLPNPRTSCQTNFYQFQMLLQVEIHMWELVSYFLDLPVIRNHLLLFILSY